MSMRLAAVSWISCFVLKCKSQEHGKNEMTIKETYTLCWFINTSSESSQNTSSSTEVFLPTSNHHHIKSVFDTRIFIKIQKITLLYDACFVIQWKTFNNGLSVHRRLHDSSNSSVLSIRIAVEFKFAINVE